MNHCFRIVWSTARQMLVVAPEHAKSTSGGGSAQHRCRENNKQTGLWARPTLRKLAGALSLFGMGAAFAGDACAMGLPTGGSITSGLASLQQTDNALTIRQDSSNLAISWQSFSIAEGNSVTFIQPSSSATAFNTVLGSDVSRIQGALNANGQVFLINPNGVLFTETAQVNVGGLVASTLAITEHDLASGRYTLEGSSANAIINQGRITAASGGLVALIGARIENTGTIDATTGNVLLGAGSKVLLDLGGPVKLEVERGALDALIEQGGAIRADGGNVWLVASAANDLISTVINHTGHTQAQTLATGEDGRIMLLGDFDHDRIVVGGTLDASAPNGGNGGFIETSAAIVEFANGLNVSTLATDGHQTGLWLIDPTDIEIVSGTGGSVSGSGNPRTSSSTSIGADSLAGWLASNNIKVETASGGDADGDITVSAAISWSSNKSLTLSAHNDINVNAAITASNAAANLTLESREGGNISQSETGILSIAGKLTASSAGAEAITSGPQGGRRPAIAPGNVSLLAQNSVTGEVTLTGATISFTNAAELKIAAVTAAGKIVLKATDGDLTIDGDITSKLASAPDAIALISNTGNVRFANKASINVEDDSGWKILTQGIVSESGFTNYPSSAEDELSQYFEQDSTDFETDTTAQTARYRIYYRDDSPDIVITVTLSGMDGITYYYSGLDDVDGTLQSNLPNNFSITASSEGLTNNTLRSIEREALTYLMIGDFSTVHTGNSATDITSYYAETPGIQRGEAGYWGWALSDAAESSTYNLVIHSDYGSGCSGTSCIEIRPRELTFATLGDDSKPSSGNQGFQVYDKFYDGTNVAFLKENGLLGVLAGDDIDIDALIEARYLSGTWDGNRNGASLETADATFVGEDIAKLTNGDFQPGGATGAAVGDGKLVAIKVSGELTGTSSRNYTFNQATTFAKANIYGFDAEVTALDVEHVYGDLNPGYNFSLEVGCLSDDCTAKAFGNLWSNGLTREQGEENLAFADRIAKSYFNDNGNQTLMSLDSLEGEVSLTVVGNDRPATNRWNVGAYDIIAGYFDSFDQSGITTRFNDALLTITPRPIVVTADNLVKNLSQSDPALTYVVTSDRNGISPGLVNGDALSGILVRSPGSTAGNYSINQGSVTDANNTNYAIRYVEGSLEIIPDPPEVMALTVQPLSTPDAEPVATDGLNYVEVSSEPATADSGDAGGDEGESAPEIAMDQTGGLGPTDVFVIEGGVNTEGYENI